MIRNVIILTFTIFVIGSRTNVAVVSGQTVPAPSTQSTAQAEKPYVPDNFGEGFGEEVELEEKEEFSYLGYTAHVKQHGVPVPHLRAVRKVNYAVLEKDGKTIATFDGKIELLSDIRFGLISLFRDEEKQLVIEQTSNKYWRYWIVRLSPKFEVIYDGGNYDAIYRLRTIDADNDGHSEIIQNLGTFWYVHYDNVYSPRPEIIFRYEPQTRRFLPANHKFQSLVLGDIESRLSTLNKNKVDQHDQWKLGAGFFDVMLRYLYAGKRKKPGRFLSASHFLPRIKKNSGKRSVNI